MKYYIKLQEDLQDARITQEQYDSAVKELHFNQVKHEVQTAKKKRGPNRLSTDEKTRRKALKEIVKWVFDVELDRRVTPLYCGSGSSSECINQIVFIKLANIVIRYSRCNPVVAATKSKKVLMDSIEEVVKNRRRNLRTNKRKAAKNPGHKQLKLAYHKKCSMMVFDDKGEVIAVSVPLPLPLDYDEESSHSGNENDNTKHESKPTPFPSVKDQKVDKLRKVQDEKIAELQRQLLLLQNQRQRLDCKPAAVVHDNKPATTATTQLRKPDAAIKETQARAPVINTPTVYDKQPADAATQLPLKRHQPHTPVHDEQTSTTPKRRRRHLSLSHRHVDSLQLSSAKPVSFHRSELTPQPTWLDRLSNKSNVNATGTIICAKCKTECDKQLAKPARK